MGNEGRSGEPQGPKSTRSSEEPERSRDGATACPRRRAPDTPSARSHRLGTRNAAPRGKSRYRSRRPPSGLKSCLLYTSDAADEEDSVDLGGRRIIKKKKKKKTKIQNK